MKTKEGGRRNVGLVLRVPLVGLLQGESHKTRDKGVATQALYSEI